MVPITPNKDVYWHVNGKRFYNKIQAWAETNNTQQPEFYHFDKEYTEYDWTQEPGESLMMLCKRRAEQIRDTYKKIRFWYSGGADSHTMLVTFLNNNIPIDEIYMWRMSAVDDFTGADHAEANNIAIPFLKEHCSHIPIKFLDIGRDYYDQIFNGDWAKRTTNHEFRCNNIKSFYEFYPELYADGDHVDLMGGEKPKVDITTKTHFYHDSSRDYQIGGEFIEDFFCSSSKEALDLHAKQCHLALRVVEEKPWLLDMHYTDMIKQTEYQSAFRVLYRQEETMGKVWSVHNPKSVIAMDMARKGNRPAVYKYLTGLRREGSYAKHRFNDNNIFNRFKGIKSKEYKLR